jgi:hypothetical protein
VLNDALDWPVHNTSLRGKPNGSSKEKGQEEGQKGQGQEEEEIAV